MLIEKYQPKKLEDVISQREVIRGIEKWLDEWKKGESLLIYGPTGTGKTLIPKLIAKRRRLNIFEINTSEELNANSIREILKPAIKEKSLIGDRLILIDGIDGISSSDRGGTAEIAKMLRESQYPIILIASDAYNPKLKTLRLYSKLLKIRKIRSDFIERKLIKIARKERLKINIRTIREIARNSDGDIRSAINDLEIASLESIGQREKEKTIFDTLKVIFKSQDLKAVLVAIRSCDKDIEEIFWWVEQNICNEFEDPEEVSAAFDLLSKADIFRNKIAETQNFRFKKYMRDLVAGVSMVKKRPYHKFVSYKPPDRLVTLGRTKSYRNEMDKIHGKLGEVLHCSKRKVREQMPYLEIILGDNIKDF